MCLLGSFQEERHESLMQVLRGNQTCARCNHPDILSRQICLEIDHSLSQRDRLQPWMELCVCLLSIEIQQIDPRGTNKFPHIPGISGCHKERDIDLTTSHCGCRRKSGPIIDLKCTISFRQPIGLKHLLRHAACAAAIRAGGHTQSPEFTNVTEDPVASTKDPQRLRIHAGNALQVFCSFGRGRSATLHDGNIDVVIVDQQFVVLDGTICLTNVECNPLAGQAFGVLPAIAIVRSIPTTGGDGDFLGRGGSHARPCDGESHECHDKRRSERFPQFAPVA